MSRRDPYAANRKETKKVAVPYVPRPRPSQDLVETLVPCPWCHALGAVPPAQLREWRAAYAELHGGPRSESEVVPRSSEPTDSELPGPRDD